MSRSEPAVEAVAEAPVKDDAPAAAAAHVARSPWQIAWARLRRDRVAAVSAIYILLLILFAASAPIVERIAGHSPSYQSVTEGVDLETGLPVGFGVNGYVLGSVDVNGHDLLVWLAYGARISLIIALIATTAVIAIALAAGIAAGYFGGAVDGIISRLIDIMAAFPFLLFAIAMSVVFGAGKVWLVLLIVIVFSWFYPARIFRADVLSLRERDFVQAARMLGAGHTRIMFRHLLPHLIPPALVFASLSLASVILFEAAISFLGFGLPLDEPSWGVMINKATQGSQYIRSPRLMLFPGTMLVLTVLAFNLLGDALRDALDPRSARL